MQTFNYQPAPVRVLFGSGRIGEIKLEAEALNGTRALVLAGKHPTGLANRTADLLGGFCAGLYTGVVPQVPYPAVRAAVAEATRLDANLLVALGGGSTIGLAKGVALETGLPILAIPTTYAGSEMTRIWGISRDGQKTTGRDLVVKPKTVIYDPELLLTLPASVSLVSGMNAMAHAVEALYAENSDPVT